MPRECLSNNKALSVFAMTLLYVSISSGLASLRLGLIPDPTGPRLTLERIVVNGRTWQPGSVMRILDSPLSMQLVIRNNLPVRSAAAKIDVALGETGAPPRTEIAVPPIGPYGRRSVKITVRPDYVPAASMVLGVLAARPAATLSTIRIPMRLPNTDRCGLRHESARPCQSCHRHQASSQNRSDALVFRHRDHLTPESVPRGVPGSGQEAQVCRRCHSRVGAGRFGLTMAACATCHERPPAAGDCQSCHRRISIPNSGFEADRDHDGRPDRWSYSEGASVDRSDPFTGRASLKLTSVPPASPTSPLGAPARLSSRTSLSLPMKSGSHIRLTCAIRMAVGVGAAAGITMVWVDSGGNVVDRTAVFAEALTAGWTIVSLDGLAPPATKEVRIELSGPGAQGVVWFDDLQATTSSGRSAIH